MDLIVAACRTLASRPRLRLLRMIHAQPDQTVQGLAANVHLAPEAASKHLKLLMALQLVTARPQGRYVHYSPIRSGVSAHRFLRGLQMFLHKVLCPEPSGGTPAPTALSYWEPIFEALVKMFTTYTHLRRLLLLRRLADRGPCTAEQLADQVRMSFDAVQRHLHKLQRRGVVKATAGTPSRWCLQSDAGTAEQQSLLKLVLHALQNRPG